jgi:hypothetical protein
MGAERGRGDARTAARILDVAERLAQVRGFNGFSYADIAAELGITKAALHYHFASKADLGEALMPLRHPAPGRGAQRGDRDPTGRRWGRSCWCSLTPAAAPGRPPWAGRPRPLPQPRGAAGPAGSPARWRPRPPTSAPANQPPTPAAVLLAPPTPGPARRRAAPRPRRSPPRYATPCAGSTRAMRDVLPLIASRWPICKATFGRSGPLNSIQFPSAITVSSRMPGPPVDR